MNSKPDIIFVLHSLFEKDPPAQKKKKKKDKHDYSCNYLLAMVL